MSVHSHEDVGIRNELLNFTIKLEEDCGELIKEFFDFRDLIKTSVYRRSPLILSLKVSPHEAEVVRISKQTVLIHKKGDRECLQNYCQICSLSVFYKVFTKIILTRISRSLDEVWPQEQAGFRQGISCLDHIQTIQSNRGLLEIQPAPCSNLRRLRKSLRQRSNECNTVSAGQSRCEPVICEDTIATIDAPPRHSFSTASSPFQLERGHENAPKLRTAVLQWKSLSWREKGLRVDGRFHLNPRFVDDILLFSSRTTEAEMMLDELNEAGKRIGLQIKGKKRQFVKNAHLNAPISWKPCHTYTSDVL